MLGVDGGNTKTLAVVADAASGEVLGCGRAGIGDIYAHGEAAAFAQIGEAVGAALAAAGAAPEDVAAAVFSLAGADWPEDFVLLRGELPRRLALPVDAVTDVVNDAIGALRAGVEDWAGLSIVLGTWCAVGARTVAGGLYHLGFWPDGAGARDLGEDALKAVYRADLGLAPTTALSDRALARFAAATPMELLHQFTRRGGREEAETAWLAPDVLDVAADGDPVALAIVRRQAEIVGAYARISAARVGLPLAGTPVVVSGGVLTHASPLLRELIMDELPGTERVRDAPAPVAGAVALALDSLGARGDAAAVGAALPSSLFERSPAWAASPSTR